MSSRQKEHEKALKAPDQFQVKAMSLLDWAMQNTRVIGLILAPVVLLVGGFFGWRYIQGQQKTGRLDELGDVQLVHEREQRKAGDARGEIQKKIDALEAAAAAKTPPPAAGAPDAAPPVPALSPQAAAEKTALEAQITAIKPDHSGSLVKFEEFFKKYPDAPEGWMAGMMAARIAVEQEKVADARPLLEKVAAASTKNAFYQGQSRLMLASVLEEVGDYDKALAEIDVLEKTASTELKPRLLLSRGRLQMLKNANAEAKATFGALIENHSASPEAQKARSIRSLLN